MLFKYDKIFKIFLCYGQKVSHILKTKLPMDFKEKTTYLKMTNDIEKKILKFLYKIEPNLRNFVRWQNKTK